MSIFIWIYDVYNRHGINFLQLEAPLFIDYSIVVFSQKESYGWSLGNTPLHYRANDERNVAFAIGGAAQWKAKVKSQ